MVERFRDRPNVLSEGGWHRDPEALAHQETDWLAPDFQLFSHRSHEELFRTLTWVGTPEQRLESLQRRIERMSTESALAKSVLQECVSLLQEVLSQLTLLAGRSHATIHSIGPRGQLLLRTPLSVLLEEDEKQVLATVPEFEVVGEGETEPDALGDLKHQLADLYQDLVETPDDELGNLPRSWKRIFNHLVVKDATT